MAQAEGEPNRLREGRSSPDPGRAWLTRARRRTWAVVAAWVVGLALMAPLASQLDAVQGDDVTDFLSSSADSTAVAEIADAVAVAERDAGQVVVVYARDGGLTAADREAVEQHRRDLVERFGEGSPPIPAADGSAVFFTVAWSQAPDDVALDAAGADLVSGVRSAVADHPAGLTVEVTGPTAIAFDVDEVFDGINTTLLLVTVVVVAVLLILTYRSPFLWLVPLLSVSAAAVVATSAVYLIASATGVRVSTPSTTIMTVLVFGAGTDYALLIVSRYRAALRRHSERHAAMWEAWRRAAPVVLASGLTSSLGLMCLMATQMNNIRGLGLVGSVGIAGTTITMLTLFPALLVVTGRGVFWPFVPRPAVAPPASSGLWLRVADVATLAPGRMLAGATVTLAAFAVAVLSLPSELGELDSFTSPAESVRGYETLTTAYPEEDGRPVTIAVPAGRQQDMVRVVEGVEGVGDVHVAGGTDGWALIEAGVTAAPDSQAETDTVLDVRARLDAERLEARVGGPAAERIDTAGAVRRDMTLAIPLVLLIVLIIMIAMLRAVLAPLLVVAAVVLSFGAALGIGALAFEHVFGFAGAEPDLPVLCFVFLVALGVDYAIFLITRIRESARQHDMTTAAREALASTAPVIASAGVVLAATFAVLMTLPYVPMVQIGFVVAVGVLLEALAVPAMLLTPLAVRLGRRLWWPGSATQAEQTVAEPVPVMSDH